MFRAFERTNVVLVYLASALTWCAFCLMLSTCTKDYSSGDNLHFNNVPPIYLRKSAHWSHPRVQNDVTILSLNGSVDFHNLFNWNVKQFYVYIVAEYSSEKNPFNQVIIWDAIVQPHNPVVNIQTMGNKYPIWDDGNSLRRKTVVLRLKWNVISNIGSLFHEGSVSSSIELPAEYMVK